MGGMTSIRQRVAVQEVQAIRALINPRVRVEDRVWLTLHRTGIVPSIKVAWWETSKQLGLIGTIG